jgi:hypothetical protein
VFCSCTMVDESGAGTVVGFNVTLRSIFFLYLSFSVCCIPMLH